MIPAHQDREQYIAAVTSSQPLDAVFWALHYNRLLLLTAAERKALELDPAQLRPDLSAEQIATYSSRADALFQWEGPIGAAFFSYPGHPHSYEQELALCIAKNPGFSESVYDAVASRGILAMR